MKLDMKLDISKLEENKCYLIINKLSTTQYIYLFKKVGNLDPNGYTNYPYIDYKCKEFNLIGNFKEFNHENLKEANIEETIWLNQCIQANKYIDYIPHIPNELDDLIKQSKELYNL